MIRPVAPVHRIPKELPRRKNPVVPVPKKDAGFADKLKAVLKGSS